ncbi:hypothetical protein BS17DRAFT_806099 [Gyrodon lividus]|nr:hypothetical protein BS17DRAFT_806099 [Gyrodon lividus]
MHAPQGWKRPTRHDASLKAQAGRTSPQDWPVEFKYPPLPIGHRLAPSICNRPVFAPHATNGAAVARRVVPPQDCGPSSSLPSTKQSLWQIPALFASLSSSIPLSSHASVDQSPFWTQSHSSGLMPSVPPGVHGGPAGPHYMEIQRGNNARCLPSTLPTPSVVPPLSLDTVNLPTAVHDNVSAPSSVRTTPCLFPFGDVARPPVPAPLTGLPSSYEFTFSCDPQLQSQRYDETTLFLQEQENNLQFHQQDLAANPGPGEAPSIPAPEQADELCAANYSSQEEFWAALFAPEVRQAHLDRNQYGTDAPPPFVTQPDPAFVTQPDPAFVTQPNSAFFCQHQDYAGTQSQPSYANYPSPVQGASASESHPTLNSDEAAVALVMSVIAPPPKKSKACSLPHASSTTNAGCSTDVTSHSIYPPSYVPTQYVMPIAGPSSAQDSSSTSQRGRKRVLEIDDDSDLESDSEGHPKRPRICEVIDGVNRYWCYTCKEWVVKSRKRIHKGKRKHCKAARYLCRICLKVRGVYREQSRKDSLKRHVAQQHSDDFPLIWETFPSILDLYHENEGPQDWENTLTSPQQ